MAPLLSIHSAPACGGKVVAPATKGGMHFRRPQGGCMVFAAKGGIKNGAEGAVPPQWNGTSYLPRAEPSTRPGGVSRSRTEPLAPRAKGPAAPSTLAAKPRQPSGIQENTSPPTGIYREMIHYRRVPRSFASLRMTVARQGSPILDPDLRSQPLRGCAPHHNPRATGASNFRTFAP